MSELHILDDDHIDFLIELMTMGAGKGSEILSEMLETPIRLFIPSLQQIRLKDLPEHLPRFMVKDLSVVDLQFNGELTGASKLVLPMDSAKTLGSILLDEEDGEDFDDTRIGVITELGNIILNSIMGTISNFLSIHFDFSLPIYESEFRNNIPPNHDSETDIILLANTRFTAESVSIEGDIALLFSLKSLDNLTDLINKYLEEL
jgi:chemotaxis protein CheC